MTRGYLVNPDLSARAIEFDIDEAASYIGGNVDDRVAVAFQQRDNATLAALHLSHEEGARVGPHPRAAQGHN